MPTSLRIPYSLKRKNREAIKIALIARARIGLKETNCLSFCIAYLNVGGRDGI